MRTINLTFEDEAFKALDERKRLIQKVYPTFSKWEDVIYHAVMNLSIQRKLKK